MWLASKSPIFSLFAIIRNSDKDITIDTCQNVSLVVEQIIHSIFINISAVFGMFLGPSIILCVMLCILNYINTPNLIISAQVCVTMSMIHQKIILSQLVTVHCCDRQNWSMMQTSSRGQFNFHICIDLVNCYSNVPAPAPATLIVFKYKLLSTS